MWSSTIAILFLVSSILTASLTDGTAPPPMFKITAGGKAYTIYMKNLNWFEAMEHCRHENKILGSIHSKEVVQIVVDTLKSYVNYHKDLFWLGAYDIDHEGEFVWLSTGRTVDNFTNWRAREPDNWRNGEHCVEMYTNGLWNDAACGMKKHVLCEDLPT